MSAIPLIIEHVATGQQINFLRIKLSKFSDKLDTKYQTEEAFGRMDPITTYQGTTRNISMSFDIGSHTVKDMIEEMDNVAQLMKFQYPVYENVDSATTLRSPPLLRVKFANYIQKEDGTGLLCAMKGMSYDPVDNYAIDKSPRIYEGRIIPIRISVNLDLTVLHEEAPGWQLRAAPDVPVYLLSNEDILFSGPLFISTTSGPGLTQEQTLESIEEIEIPEQQSTDSIPSNADFEEERATATAAARSGTGKFNKIPDY